MVVVGSTNESFGTQILHWLCYYAVSQKNVPLPNIFFHLTFNVFHAIFNFSLSNLYFDFAICLCHVLQIVESA